MREESLRFALENMVLMTPEIIEKFSEMDSRLGQKEVRSNSDYYNLSKFINSRGQPLDYNRCPSKSSVQINIGNQILP